MGRRAPDWLYSSRKDMELITEDAAREHWPGPGVDDAPYYNYRLEHVRQIESDALLLEESPGGTNYVSGARSAREAVDDRAEPQVSELFVSR